MPRVTMIYGGPGTGKTHALLDELALRLKSVPAKEIAYVSYTRQGTYQGVDLAKEQFDLTEADCCYFKTLHSLAYHSLENVSSSSLVTLNDLRPIITKLGLNKGQFSAIEREIGIAKNKGEENPTILNNGSTAGQQRLTREVYDAYKKLINKLDYTDLLLLVKEKGIKVPVKIAFIDEAQDLTTLQWQVVWQFFLDADELIVAGDPNQAIFEWAGADVNYFLKMHTDEQRVLEKSYRCSQAVWNLAKSVYACIKEKAPIPDKGTDEIGFATVSNTTELPVSYLLSMAMKGSTYCLAMQNTYLDKYIETCVTYGIMYAVKTLGRTNHCVRPDVRAYFRDLYETITTPSLFQYMIKENAKRPRKDDRRTRKRKEQYEADGVINWDFSDSTAVMQSMFALVCKKVHKKEEQAILIRSIATGYILAPDYVLCTNVHQVKGGEADYVLFCDNVARMYAAQAERDDGYRDYLLRVMYVAVTRAKKGICVWHRNEYRTVAPTYMFNNVGSFEGMSPSVSSIAEDYITKHIKEDDTNVDNNN